jgi:hypothetical protein
MDELAAYCDKRGLERGCSIPCRDYMTGKQVAILFIQGIDPVTGVADTIDEAYEQAATSALAILVQNEAAV